MKYPRMGVLCVIASLTLTTLFLIGPSSCDSSGSNSNIVELTILHTNDIHSHYRPAIVGTEDNPFGLGGLARIKTLVSQIRSQKKNVLLLDGGDFSEGTAHEVLDVGSSMLELMDAIGYNGTVVGNHDFLNGPVELSNTIERAHPSFPVLGGNYSVATLPATEQARFARNVKNYVIVNVGGVRVALIGVMCDDVLYYPFYKPAQITNVVDNISAITQKIKSQNLADMIVLLSHNSYNKNQLWAKTIPWTNVIVSGHSHHKLSEPYVTTNAGKPAYVVEAQEWGFFLGELTLNVDLKNKTVTMKDYKIHPIDSSIAEDPTVLHMIEDREQKLVQKFGHNILNDYVAEADHDFSHDTKHESMLGNFLTEAYREELQADVGLEISELMGYGFKGALSTYDLFQAQPHIYSPATGKTWTLFKLPVSGANLKALLNAGYLATNLGLPLGWVPFSGAQITYTYSNGATPVKTVKVFNRATGSYENVIDNQTYTIATPQGVMIAFREIFSRLGIAIDLSHAQDTGIEAWQALVDYASNKQVLRMSDYEPGLRAHTTTADLMMIPQWVNLVKNGSNGYNLQIRVENNGLAAAPAATLEIKRSIVNDYVNDQTSKAETIYMDPLLKVPALGAGQSVTLEMPWPANLGAGDYGLRVVLLDATGNASLQDGNTGNNTVVRHVKF